MKTHMVGHQYEAPFVAQRLGRQTLDQGSNLRQGDFIIHFDTPFIHHQSD